MNDQQNTPPPDRFRAAADQGLRVFPAHHKSKTAAVKWKQYQTEAPTAEDLARWDASELNVCVVTGTPEGVAVLDVDNKEAQEFVDTLNLPPTATVLTARGRHYYFHTPPIDLRNTVRVKGVKLDFRGAGGYVIGAGSIHPDGTLYQWENSPADVGFALFPEQLLALLEANKHKPSRSTQPVTVGIADPARSGIERYITSELGEAVKDLNAAAVGERNDT